MNGRSCPAALGVLAIAGAACALIGCARDSEGEAASGSQAGTGGPASGAGGGSAGASGASGASGAGGTAGAAGAAPRGGTGGARGGGTGGSSESGRGASGSGGAGTAGSAGGGAGGAAGSDAGADAGEPRAQCVGGPAPPETWQEHWFEHDQNLMRVFHDDCVAVYFDTDVDREQTEWVFAYVSRIWEYSLATYGAMGEERLFVIFHQGKYGGGHPSYWYDDSHDNRNVADQGAGDFHEGNYDLVSHEIGHVVESTAPYPRRTSPAFGLWGDSKWAEFYQYDVYVALGMTEHAQEVFERFSNGSDDFPRPGTRWFRDWFHPLWRDHGGAQVMASFFQLLHDHYEGGGMNWGEYVHFTSGAAGTDLQALATAAFGWPDEWTQQLAQARAEYPDVVY